jgi:hypothetical protein
VGYSDVDGSVAAMKAHLEKYITKDPNTCIRCERVDKGSVASTCQRMANAVKACYSSGSTIVQCQLVSSVRLIASQIQLHRIKVAPDYTTAILQRMKV